MPRRSRGHVYRKRMRPETAAPPVVPEARAAEPAQIDGEPVDLPRPAVVPPVAAPYIRRQGSTATLAQGAASPRPVRPSRMLTTDYGYVVSELQRIGITFAGLIVLLIVVARLLH